MSRRLRERARLAMRDGCGEVVLALLARAVQLDPTPEGYGELGDAFWQIDRAAEALSAHLHAVTLAPGLVDVHRRLGRLLREQNRLAEAMLVWCEVQRLETIHAHLPSPSTLAEIGHVLRAQGRLADARPHYQDAIDSDPQCYDAWRGLGETHAANKDWELAIRAYEHALAALYARDASGRRSHMIGGDWDDLRPLDIPSGALPPGVSWGGKDIGATGARVAELYAGIGEAFFRLGRIADAAEACRMGLNSDHRNVGACRQLVLALEVLGQTRDVVGAWVSLGMALESDGRLEEARTAFRQALARKPDCLKALIHLGRTHAALDEPQQAIRSLERAVAINPAFPLPHTELGRALHTIGDTERAWDELAWFAHPNASLWRAFEQPRWDGTPLDGQTILVWADQELGDTIHFARYISVLNRLGATRVLVECQSRLVPLITSLEGVDGVIGRGAPLPHVDVQTPLTALPVLLRRHGVPMPNQVPYLSVPSTLVRRWKERLIAGTERRPRELTVGLCWAGHPEGIAARARFTSLASFAPLAGMRAVRFISLQMGPRSPELLRPPRGLQVEHLQNDTCSISDTAALMCSLDLIISVDTMVPHLAGALARPVWLALPRPADWRWMRDRDDSPWYPTMRLFRQSSPGAWMDVFQSVRATLEARLPQTDTHTMDVSDAVAVSTSSAACAAGTREADA
jgi:tetratricopeptide (TPR) repeat protein